MTDENGPGSDVKTADLAGSGLALLQLMADAADPGGNGWVNRRVQQLEFLDTRAVRWQVSVDFNVPAGAPDLTVGGKKYRLVPVMPWEKADLVAFDLRDEQGNVMWLPNSDDINFRLSAALTQWAEQILSPVPAAGTQAPVPFPARLGTLLEEIVRCQPPDRIKSADPFDGIVALLNISGGGTATGGMPNEFAEAISRLRTNVSFMSRLQELWQNYLFVAALIDPAGTRRIIKLTFESQVSFRQPKSLHGLFFQSLGWRSWRLYVLIGGRGGSHHLEVAAPTGVDVVRISAQPAVGPGGEKYNTEGGTPHVHIKVPASQHARFRATIRVRVSRPGWLTTTWLSGLVIAAVMLIGRAKIAVLFSKAPGSALGEAGTAATLLLALLAVFGSSLFGPGGHPLASRLLRAARLLILLDSAAVLVGAGSLLIYTVNSHLPTRLWSILAIATWGIAALLTISMLFPRGPQSVVRVSVLSRLTGARRVILRRRTTVTLPRQAGTVPAGESARIWGGDVVAIPSADGYSYADDHAWTAQDHARLVNELTKAQEA
jgi:hypothetical protein